MRGKEKNYAWIFQIRLIERGWADYSRCREICAWSLRLEAMLKRNGVQIDENKPVAECTQRTNDRTFCSSRNNGMVKIYSMLVQT